jgi:hypothetical protein
MITSDRYWSSTENDSDLTCLLNFFFGFVSYHNKDNTNYVRCVRGH